MRRTLFVFFVLLVPSLALAADSPPREFRGVWVASVGNIDWPSRPGLSTAQQQAELRSILDCAARLRFNVVILQVRPMADALYASKLEPWSEYLTGTLCKPPEPYYDPLTFAVHEAHARGLQLHAWFNPFRARHPSAKSPIPPNHVIRRYPDWAKHYGTHYWLNPTHPDVQKHSLAVILDVVRRYDIDGIHIDDYFYPYPEKDHAGRIIAFPDDDTWTAYVKHGGKRNRDDWRRAAINDFVNKLYLEVKAAKPWVRVGISPFGIWRPHHPPGVTGFDAYQTIDADSRLWLREGWCDYFAPQLYWRTHDPQHDYTKLLAWWVRQSNKGRHLCPGNYSGRVTGRPGGWPAQEIVEQITLARQQKGVSGNIQFNVHALLHNTGGVADAIRTVYTEPALVPPLSWLKWPPPARPVASMKRQEGRYVLTIRPAGQNVRMFIIRSLQRGRWTTVLVPADKTAQVVTINGQPEKLTIVAIDRAGNESSAVSVR